MSGDEYRGPRVGDGGDPERCRLMLDAMRRLAEAVQEHEWIGHIELPGREDVGRPDVASLTLRREGEPPVVDTGVEVSGAGALVLGCLAMAIERQTHVGKDALPDVAIFAAAILAVDSAIAAGIFEDPEPEYERPERPRPVQRRRSRSHLATGSRRERRSG